MAHIAVDCLMFQINSPSDIEIAATYISIVQATQVLYGPQGSSIARMTRHATTFSNSLLIVNLTCTDYCETPRYRIKLWNKWSNFCRA